MWTPRRVLLLLTGTLLFVGVYGVYAYALGWIDGLPQLPARMLARTNGEFRPPERSVLPTVQLLREAFGKECAEENTSVYANQFTFKSGDSWVVVATGRVPNPEGKSVSLSPFSVAVFGKPRPPHLRAPGEVPEVSTFHADKAVFEFDRPVSGLADMQKANVVRMELVSEPEATTDDKRRGLVHITNNQRSADPHNALVLRTPGPVFYRDPKKAGPKATGPDIWTDAAIEVVDKQNLPRGPGEPAPQTAPTRGRDLRDEPGVVQDIIAGHRLPPPTVTAVGLRVFLDDRDRAAPKKGSAGFSGVRRLELGEKVLLNLWVDARQSVVSTPGGDGPATGGSPLGVRDEPEAAAAVVGGLFTAAQTIRRLDRALLQVETLGPFAYDAEKNTARFDVIPQADPNVLNDVQVTRMPPRGKPQKLFSQVLEIEFHGPPTGDKPAEPPAGGKDARPAGPSFKQLHAWAYTPGRLISVESEEDRLTAFGYDLVHDQAKNSTVLKGAPLTAIRQNEPRADGKPAGGNVLTAGAAGRPASLTMSAVTTETKLGPRKTNTAVVDGAGTMKLFDPNSGSNTIEATWATSLTHTKEQTELRELDLLTFAGAAMFEDRKADFWLKGNVLKLWLDRAGPGGGGQPLPHRVQALGDVTSHSAEYDIERSDHLNVQFEEGTFQPTRPPAAVAAAPPVPQPAPGGPAAPPTGTPPAAAAAPPPKEEPKPKPPMKLRARVINTWVVRAAVKNDQVGLDRPGSKMSGLAPNDPVSKAEHGGGTKYHLRRASCEGSELVNGQHAPLVHQDPTDPAKHPRGIDIFGATLHLDQTPDGGVMTVTGEGNRFGEVHHEGMSVVGPKVVIDQLRNKLFVEGTGSMVLPASSSLSGGEPQKAAPAANAKAGADGPPPPPVVIHWRDQMVFEGALKSAEFLGRVRATQGESSVSCHTLQVFFDKPVLFNTATRQPNPAAPAGEPRPNPKIERVLCYPAPGDAPDEPAGAHHVAYMEVAREPGGRLAKWQYLKAQSLELTAKAADPAGKEPYQLVTATGPGEVRIWQYGEKDVAKAPGAAPPKAAAPKATAPPAKAPEGEMKLTIVTFTGRMVAKDKGKLYQEAVFYSEQQGGTPIEVVHAPAADPGVTIPKANPPGGTVTLTCADKLVVSTHRPENAPAAQRMDAYGNVFIRTDEYDGWGEIVNSDGRFVTLTGAGNALARIVHRFNNTIQAAEKITYDRVTGNFNLHQSPGGTFQSPGR